MNKVNLNYYKYSYNRFVAVAAFLRYKNFECLRIVEKRDTYFLVRKQSKVIRIFKITKYNWEPEKIQFEKLAILSHY